MTQRYIFFNSAVGDPRTYQASDFAEYFGSVLSTGLLHTDNVPGMSVSVETGTLNTVVSAGKAIMKGHFYDNTADLTLTHAIPEASLNRIDRIVLRLDLRNSERNILLKVVTGVASSTPVVPVLQRDNFIHEVSLAQILVRGNTVQLLQSDLVDERLDETLCGLVYSLISIPTSQFQAEWDAFMTSVQNDGFTPVDTFNAHVEESAIDAHNANNISVIDANAHFTGANVETVLEELFTFANDGKTAVASAVTAKGVTASPTDTFSALATKIGQINTGKKFATGSITSVGNVMTVTGLAFQPKLTVAVLSLAGANNNYYASMSVDSLIFGATIGRNSITVANGAVTSTGGTFTANGFTLNVGSNAVYNWIAFE